MTKQQQNDIILASLNESLRQAPDIYQRITRSFTMWFQTLVQLSVQPPPVQQESNDEQQ